jgi:hypothetical protein
MAAFSGTGKTYRVDFAASRVVLCFSSDTSLTYTVENADGSPGTSETVTIRTEEIGLDLFLVTWQAADSTTVVHIEDYARGTIISNVTDPDLKFRQLHGTFAELPAHVA